MEETDQNRGAEVQRLDLRRSARGESFYAVGGPVQPDRDCYIEREADRQLYERLLGTEYCHVLAPRQSGKSSLVARCAKRLRSAGMSAAVVDLAQFGGRDNLPEAGRWYYGIAYRIVRDLRLKVNLQQWWQEKMPLGAAQRLGEFFWEVVLGNTTEPVAIFLDGLDEVDELPFAADFFSSVRACYDARATEPDYERLAFAVVGTGPPRERMLPAERSLFDIGKRVELNDFTFEEARPLCRGLSLPPGEADRVLYRILYWTGGQPFLTQKISRAAARSAGRVVSDDQVDTLVEERFFGRNAFYTEPNLCRVRETLARGGRLQLPALRLYRRIHGGRMVPLDPDSPVHDLLRVAGLVRVVDGRLVVRNRIYANVFSARWAKKSRPTDWRGLMTTAAALLVLVGIPWWYTRLLPEPYIHALEGATVDYPVALDAYSSLRMIPGFRDTADELFAGVLARRSRQAVTLDEVRAADRDLRGLLGRPVVADNLLADFWSRLASAAEAREHRDQALMYRLEAARVRGSGPDAATAQLIGADYPRLITTVRPAGRVEGLAVPVDGDRIVTMSMGNQVEVWDPRNGLPIGHPRALLAEDFVPVTRRVSVDVDGRAAGLRLTIDTTHSRLTDLVGRLTAPSGATAEFALDDGIQGEEGRIRITPAEAPGLSPLAEEAARGTWRLDIEDRRGDQAGELLQWSLFLGESGGVQVVDQPENPLPLADPRSTARVRLALSPGGRWAAAVSRNPDARGHALIWDVEYARPVARIPLDAGERRFRFDASGDFLVILSKDGRRFSAWRAATGSRVLDVRTDGRFTGGLVASPDGGYAAVAESAPEAPMQIRRWRLEDGVELDPAPAGGEVARLALGPAGRLVATADGQQVVRVWDGGGERLVAEQILDGPVQRLEIDPSGRWLLVAEEAGVARVLALPPSRRAGQILVVSSRDPAALAFDPAGDHLVTLLRGRSHQIWALPEARPVSPLLRHNSRRLVTGPVPEGTAGAVMSPAGGFVVTGIGTETARVWRLDDVAPTAAASLADGSVVNLDPRGTRLAEGGSDGRVLFRPVAAGQTAGSPIRVPPPRHPGRVVVLAFDRLGESLLSVADDDSVSLWDARSGDTAGPVFYHGVGQGPVAALARGGARALVAGANGAELWDAATGQLLGPLGPGQAVTAVSFGPTGTRAALAVDGQVQVWDVIEYRLEWQAELGSAARSVAFTADGRRLAAGTQMGEVRVWDIGAEDAGGRELRIDGPVLGLAFAPEGSALLMQSSEWLHRIEDDGTRLSIAGSQLLPGYLPADAWTAARPDAGRVLFLDQSGRVPTLTVLGWDTRVLPAVDVPAELHAAPWSERLKLVLDGKGAVVPGVADLQSGRALGQTR